MSELADGADQVQFLSDEPGDSNNVLDAVKPDD